MKRKPLPKGAILDIDEALMCNENAARAVLCLARLPGSDGRLTEVMYYVHESSAFLKRARQVKAITVDLLMFEFEPLIEKYKMDRVEVSSVFERVLEP